MNPSDRPSAHGGDLGENPTHIFPPTRVSPFATHAGDTAGDYHTFLAADTRASDLESAPVRSVIAGKFDTKATVINLGVLTALSMVITFAMTLVADQITGALSSTVPRATSDLIVLAVLAGAIGVTAGVLYIPVVDTANESLYSVAILALALASAAGWVFFGGLFDGDWSEVTILAAIICTTAAAYAAPSRIDAARVQ